MERFKDAVRRRFEHFIWALRCAGAFVWFASDFRSKHKSCVFPLGTRPMVEGVPKRALIRGRP